MISNFVKIDFWSNFFSVSRDDNRKSVIGAADVRLECSDFKNRHQEKLPALTFIAQEYFSMCASSAGVGLPWMFFTYSNSVEQ